jgi:hypothetical protein
MPLLLVVMVSGLATPAPRAREWVLGGLVAIQFLLLPTASWLLMTRSLRVLAKEGPDAVLLRNVPERLLARHFRQVAEPGEFILFAHSFNTVMAELPARAAGVSWHSRYVWDIRLAQVDWPAMFEASGATHVVYRKRDAEPGLADALAARQAIEVASAGSATLVRLAPLPAPLVTRQSADGSIQASLAMDPEHSVAGWLQVAVQCRQAGEILALEWELERPGRPPQRRWDQQICGADGSAVIKAYYTSLANPGSLHLNIKSVQDPHASMLHLQSAQALRRRDPAADSERFHVVWDALCARPGCGRDRTTLLLDRWNAPRR